MHVKSPGLRICLQCRRAWFDSWVGKIPWRRDRLPTPVFLGFAGGSDGKESPAMWETWVPSLGWENGKIPWRRERLPTPIFWPGKFPWREEPGGLKSIGSPELDTTE